MRNLAAICLILFSLSAFAQTVATSDEIEIRARDIGASLRCVVCQNQSIEESDAALAKDMRLIVREHVTLGKSDAEIIEFMRLRYGDYVLLNPPLQKNTYLLWFLPSLLIFGMGIWLVIFTRKKQAKAVAPREHSNEDMQILKRLMDDNS